ncbi:MAG: choice-of-anchor L domain-containing protein, partial [Lewinella sp.]|nr:choice-of-anchor L domain-containing protein [Lewinella sp.]
LSNLWSQTLEVTNSPPITPENLITNVFLGDGVEVLNVQFSGDPAAVGFFNLASDEIGMERGIVMTTGKAVTSGADFGVNAVGDNQASEGTTSTFGDVDLQSIAGQGTAINDVAVYTITFVPTADTLRFSYAFGSEEYPEYACSNFNDIFGFFISGPGISGGFSNNGKNIALIPGTNLPVRINNVNPGVVGSNGSIENCTPPSGTLAYSQYYNDNNDSNIMPVYDGFTDVFIAEAVVQPCSTYVIKLAICDVGDSAFDSGVFLEAKSFGTGSLDVEINGLAIDGGVAEGCTLGEIVFSLPNPVEDNFLVDFSVGGTATPDIDYPALPDSVWILAGDSLVTIPLSAYEDGIEEGDETIELSVQLDPCNRDTFTIVIKDNRLEPPDLGPDLSICAVDSIQLDGTVPIPLPDPPTFINNTPLPIETHNVPYISEIDVFGVLPTNLGPEAIMMICIDSLDHRWIDDLDIYLVSPGGQFLELTTDNGGNGGNGLGFDQYLGTCFTIDATTPINFPGPLAPPSAVPFTGNWLPEGVWSDLWDGGDKPTNGTWQLVITDDTQSLGGTLHSWRIVFNPVYQVDYSWSPAAGLSCTDCPDPWASPDTTTTYVLTLTDSYGCTATDTITIEAIPGVQMTEVVCSQVTTNSVEVIWSDAPGATGYEVSINGGPWMAPSGALSHIVTGLDFLESVTISVRALASCPGEPVSTTCTTLDCTPPTLLATPVAVSCYDGADGSVQINVSSGTGPFSYTVAGNTNDTGDFSGLAAGNYTAQVEDGTGCIGSIG